MPDRLAINHAHLTAARRVLNQPHLYWLLGGSASGKSTVAALLAARSGIAHLDVDTLVFDRFQPRYDPVQHPASCAWFHAPNPLAWVLSLDWPAFDALTGAADAEALALLAEELADRPVTPLLLDGGFAHPAVVAQVAAPARIVCLTAPAAARRAAWETDPGRAAMRGWIHALPEPERQWRKFLNFDARQAETMQQEAAAAGIAVIERRAGDPTQQTADSVAAALNLASA